MAVSRLTGRVREYELNPRYPFLQPLKELLKAAVAAYPSEIISDLMVQRTRPRQAGKPLVTATGRKTNNNSAKQR